MDTFEKALAEMEKITKQLQFEARRAKGLTDEEYEMINEKALWRSTINLSLAHAYQPLTAMSSSNIFDFQFLIGSAASSGSSVIYLHTTSSDAT